MTDSASLNESNIESNISDFAASMDELAEQTDRGAAIIGVAVLDDHLKAAIECRLRPLTKGLRKKLFNAYGPLSTFNSRIDFASALGIFPKFAIPHFHKMREIRNEFAHKTHAIDFEDEKIVGLCKNMSDLIGVDKKPRDQFMLSLGGLILLLFAARTEKIRIDSVAPFVAAEALELRSISGFEQFDVNVAAQPKKGAAS